MAKQQAKPMAQPAAAKTTPAPAPAAQNLGGSRTATQTAGRPATTATSQKQTANEEQIRIRAYQKWEAAGRPCGDGARFWLEAEREIKASR